MNHCEDIPKARLPELAAYLATTGKRLVQVACVKAGEGRLDLIYTFDEPYRLESYRLNVASGETVSSITQSYPGAYLYENEIGELFGLTFEGLSVDFKGTLYDSIVHAPFNLLPAKGGLGAETASDTTVRPAGEPTGTGAANGTTSDASRTPVSADGPHAADDGRKG